MLTTAVFELVQQFYRATEIVNVAICGQRLRCSAIADKKRQSFWIKWTVAEHNL